MMVCVRVYAFAFFTDRAIPSDPIQCNSTTHGCQSGIKWFGINIVYVYSSSIFSRNLLTLSVVRAAHRISSGDQNDAQTKCIHEGPSGAMRLISRAVSSPICPGFLC